MSIFIELKSMQTFLDCLLILFTSPSLPLVVGFSFINHFWLNNDVSEFFRSEYRSRKILMFLLVISRSYRNIPSRNHFLGACPKIHWTFRDLVDAFGCLLADWFWIFALLNAVFNCFTILKLSQANLVKSVYKRLEIQEQYNGKHYTKTNYFIF